MFTHCAPRSARLAVQITLVLLIGLSLFPTISIADPEHPGVSTADSAPGGLVAIIKGWAPKEWPLDPQVLNNPSISGIALQIRWRDIEPAEGKLDWTQLDQLFAGAESSKKWVQLSIFPGFFSPAWALEGVKTDQFPVQYGPDKGTVAALPMPWDRVYLDRWFAFLKQLSDRYGTSPAFKLISVDGPTSVSEEMTLPQTPEDIAKWQKDSYRPSKYIGAWQETFKAFAADFPNQYISLAGSGGLRINDQGKLAAGEHLRTRQAIVNDAIDLLGRRCSLELHDVHAGTDKHDSSSEAEDQFIIAYNGRIVTGFEMTTAVEGSKGAMGPADDPPLALKESINLAMEPNKDGKHVNYVEIYEPDALADEMQPVLRDAALLFAR